MHATDVLDTYLRMSCQAIHEARWRALKDCVGGLLLGRQLSVTGLGRTLAVGGHEKHRIKKADRLIGNPRLKEELPLLYRAVSQLVVGKQTRPVILVDWSDVTPDQKHHVLRASVPIGGRAITLYEEVHLQADYGSRSVHARFLRALRDQLRPEVRPILVSDAGFKAPWFKAVERMGWSWVGRIRAKALVRRNVREEWYSCTELHHQIARQPKCLGEFEVTRSNPVHCMLFGVRKPKKGRVSRTSQGKRRRSQHSNKNARREREPWLIGTSLTSLDPGEVIGIYAKRMEIEEAFRDTKSRQYGFGLELTRSRSKSRLAVLMALGSLASLVAWLLGRVAECHGMSKRLQANTIRHRRVLSTVFIGLAALRNQFRFKRREVALAVFDLRARAASWAL